jgi:hypothetical protein
MRYRELFEQLQANQPLFHVTTPRRVKLILQSGIEPNHHRRWKGLFGDKLGERGYIYLISDLTAAIRWAATLQQSGKNDTPIEIVCVGNVDPAKLEPDPNPFGKLHYPGKWFQMQGSIKPKNILRVIPLTPELVQQVMDGGTITA